MIQNPDDPFVDTYLLYLLAAASRAASAEFHAIVRAEGLRVPEWRVLACLHDHDGLMITHMVDIAFVEQSNLTKIVDQMDENGLVGPLLGPVALQGSAPVFASLLCAIIDSEILGSTFRGKGRPVSYSSFLIKMEIYPASFLMVRLLTGRVQL